ncbi:hypothetical protein L218DRAFT_1078669 [Marasmius fiardii PR-910]|nr:hypothetical protein L218DRAFT_1078669 [Marasmius fiardii PR-910]
MSSASTTAFKNFQLFPTPSVLPASRISPRPLPGISLDSTETLKVLLQDDYHKHHVFLNDQGFHNHIIHHLLACWTLGTPRNVLQRIYEFDSSFQKAAIDPPEPITVNNFKEHLGDERFYQAYLKYFVDQMKQKDAATVFEEHVFSPEWNFGTDQNGGPEMLSRFLDSLIHPLIHTGYGIEFELPGIVAEGLAQAAMHASNSVLVPASLFSGQAPGRSDKSVRADGVHAFHVLARIIEDEKIGPTKAEGAIKVYKEVIERFGEKILKHVAEWAQFDTSDPKVVERKIEELQWVNVLLHTLPGFKETAHGGDFNADFYMMHLVTSSLFLGPLISALSSPTSKHLLLQTYFGVSLIWWVTRGKPSLDIDSFYAAPPPSGTEQKTWSELIQHAVVHPDDHFVKCQRALAHYSVLYGTRKSGESDFCRTELKGAEKLDGNLFLRAANLTSGRVDKGARAAGPESSTFWDRNGFF